MNENLPAEKRPYQHSQDAIFDVFSKQIISKKPAQGNRPRHYIFLMKLVDAADMVRNLMAYEEYGVCNRLKTHKLKYSSETGSSAVAVFKCNRHGKSAEEKRAINKAKGQPIQRIRDSKGTHCRAEIRIKFGDFYQTKNGCLLNVDDFGDSYVEVMWKLDHNHKEAEIDKHTKMQMDEYVRKQVEVGVTWSQFSANRKKLLLSTKEGQVSPALLRIEYHNWFNEGRRQTRLQAVNDENIR